MVCGGEGVFLWPADWIYLRGRFMGDFAFGPQNNLTCIGKSVKKDEKG
jgi:hypothetical protein